MLYFRLDKWIFTSQKYIFPQQIPSRQNKSALMLTLPDVTVHKNCKSRQNNIILNHVSKKLKLYS